jgi:thiol-disulfide isomerase/thioredoxin
MSVIPAAPPAVRLYFFHQTGCGACEEAAPHLDRFKLKNLRVMVIKLNVAMIDWSIRNWEPSGTPGYLLLVDDEPVFKHTGVLTEKELDHVLKQALRGDGDSGSRRRKRSRS